MVNEEKDSITCAEDLPCGANVGESLEVDIWEG